MTREDAMTYGEMIESILSKGPISQDDLVAQMEARGAAPVFTSTVLVGMEYRGQVVVKDGIVSLPGQSTQTKGS
jgi:hypothetical protein